MADVFTARKTNCGRLKNPPHPAPSPRAVHFLIPRTLELINLLNMAKERISFYMATRLS